jgi:hypothetical protein
VEDIVWVAASGGGVVEVKPEVVKRVNGGVGGSNTIRGIGRGRDFEFDEVEEATVDAHVEALRIHENAHTKNFSFHGRFGFGFAVCWTFSSPRDISMCVDNCSYGASGSCFFCVESMRV